MNNITHSGVLAAIDEFDALGRDEFLKQYGFNKARDYYLLFKGRVYDSKAIVGAAAEYSGLNGSALKASEFSGGKDTVVKTLKTLVLKRQVHLKTFGRMKANTPNIGGLITNKLISKKLVETTYGHH